MDTEKVKAGLKLAREVIELIDKIVDAELVMTLMSNRAMDPYDKKMFDEVEKWANLISGNLAGYEQELSNFYKYRILRSREVTRGKFADITITDPVTKVAKAMQLKSTNQDTSGAVTDMIAEAANQLAGERGETPADGQRRVIDVAIQSPNNPWPFGKLEPRGSKRIADVTQKGETVVLGALTDYLPHGTIKINPQTKLPNKQPSAGRGLNPTAFNKLTDVTGATNVAKVGPNKTAMLGDINGTRQLLIGTTIKIRYKFPYQVIDQVTHTGTTYKWVDELVFEANRLGTNLRVTHVKTKYAT